MATPILGEECWGPDQPRFPGSLASAWADTGERPGGAPGATLLSINRPLEEKMNTGLAFVLSKIPIEWLSLVPRGPDLSWNPFSL